MKLPTAFTAIAALGLSHVTTADLSAYKDTCSLAVVYATDTSTVSVTSISLATVTETAYITSTSSGVANSDTDSSSLIYSFAVQNGSTSWINGFSPTLSTYDIKTTSITVYPSGSSTQSLGTSSSQFSDYSTVATSTSTRVSLLTVTDIATTWSAPAASIIATETARSDVSTTVESSTTINAVSGQTSSGMVTETIIAPAVTIIESLSLVSVPSGSTSTMTLQITSTLMTLRTVTISRASLLASTTSSNVSPDNTTVGTSTTVYTASSRVYAYGNETTASTLPIVVSAATVSGPVNMTTSTPTPLATTATTTYFTTSSSTITSASSSNSTVTTTLFHTATSSTTISSLSSSAMSSAILSTYTLLSFGTSSVPSSDVAAASGSGNTYPSPYKKTSTTTVALPNVTPSMGSIWNTTTNATTMSVATPTATCGVQGNTLMTWDDEPLFVTNSTDLTQAPPIFGPYHRFEFSEGFVYAPGPAEPYRPVSEPHLAVFITNSSGASNDVPNSWIHPGEVGAEQLAMEAFWFNAYSAYLGCDNIGPSECTMVVSGYTYTGFTDDEIMSYQQNFTIPPCPGNNCQLQYTEFPPSMIGLSGLQILAYIGNEQRIWFMDNLLLGWYDTTCAAGLQRAAVPNTVDA